MQTPFSPTDSARRTLHLERDALHAMAERLTGFDDVIAIFAACRGRVVVSGVGKSAIVAQKIAATFNSTGTPALFLHAADAIHGDLGMVQPDDVVIILSKSGESPEIRVLAPLIRGFGNKLIGMVGNRDSYLATCADGMLDTTVESEACPNGLAPTTSTTAQMAMGDAVAVALMESRGFRAEDFARYHPGGTLGKRLYLRVGDLSSLHPRPQVYTHSSLKEVIVEMAAKRLGATAVLHEGGTLAGVVTDGDLRRMLERTEDLRGITAAAIMSPHPKTIAEGEMAAAALALMRQHAITQLMVVNEAGDYAGVVHLHDLLKEGII